MCPPRSNKFKRLSTSAWGKNTSYSNVFFFVNKISNGKAARDLQAKHKSAFTEKIKTRTGFVSLVWK